MRVRGLLVIVLVVWLPAVRLNSQADIAPRARQLHDRAIVVDTHDDTTQRLIFDTGFDIGARQASGSIDIPGMREGGLDAIFFSIWITGDVTGPLAVKRALQQIDAVRQAVRTHPRDLVLATSVAEIRRASRDGKYSEGDVRKILGGNLLRVMEQVERVAAAQEIRRPHGFRASQSKPSFRLTRLDLQLYRLFDTQSRRIGGS